MRLKTASIEYRGQPKHYLGKQEQQNTPVKLLDPDIGQSRLNDEQLYREYRKVWGNCGLGFVMPRVWDVARAANLPDKSSSSRYQPDGLAARFWFRLRQPYQNCNVGSVTYPPEDCGGPHAYLERRDEAGGYDAWRDMNVM
ncbi:hypothetical protein FJU08_19430, partial [Martelella alba]